MNIGKKIAMIRKSKNITQEQLAAKLGKTPQWLSNIERGVRFISTEDLAKIANLLQVNPGIFFAEEFNVTCSIGQNKTTA